MVKGREMRTGCLKKMASELATQQQHSILFLQVQPKSEKYTEQKIMSFFSYDLLHILFMLIYSVIHNVTVFVLLFICDIQPVVRHMTPCIR